MRFRALLLPVLVGCAFAASPGLSAQSIVGGSLSGTTARSDGGVVAQALVTLTSLDGGFRRQMVATRSGTFTFEFLEPGNYELRAEALGFRPGVVIPVRIVGGDATVVRIELRPTQPPVEAVDTVTVPGAGPSVWRADGMRLGPRLVDALPDIWNDLSSVAALSSRSDEDLGSEGLPGDMTQIVVDGVPFYRAGHPAMRGEQPASAMFTRSSLSGVDVLDSPADVEWGGASSGFLATTTRSAVGPTGTALGGGWSGDPLWNSSTLDLQKPSLVSYWGTAATDVALEPDRSRLFVSGEALQIETPLEPRLSAAGAGLLTSLDPGVAAALTEPAIERTRRASGVARVNLLLGEARRMAVRASAGRVQREFTGFGPSGLVYGGAPPETATDFSISGEFVSSYDEGLAFELRGGVSGSSRSYGPAAAGWPAATLTGTGIVLGGPASDIADASRVDVHVSPVIHYVLGPGVIKGGGAVRLSQHSETWGGYDEGAYRFSDPAAVAAGDGAVVKSSGVPKSSFATTEVGVFAQYEFELAPGLKGTLGGRYDYEVLPTSELERAIPWFDASGMRNDLWSSKLNQLGGMGSLSWDVTGDGRTLVDGTMSVINGDVDPAILHEAFGHDGAAKIVRYVGSGLQWPSGSVPATGKTGPTLTILGPDSRAPRTTRASVGLVHHAGGGWNFYLGATNRRTDFLVRRRNLNLATFPLARDSHGRDVLGTLEQLGSMIAVEPGTNRRFTSFDDAWVIDTDGWSEYRGATVGVEHRSTAVDLFASYTHSQTRDNWLGAAAGLPEAQLQPGIPVDDDWTEGTSDFDVPDRAVGGLTVGLGPDRMVSVTAVGRYESGLPFTPGYRAGVDINGDGSAINDVAWVPDAGAIAGLTGDWPCLNAQAGRFADRNSCRGPARTGVDVRLNARIARVGGRAVALSVDVYNLVERVEGIRDTALLLVDPAGSITTSSDGGTLTLPLTVNPDFGKILVPMGPGRVIRIGLRLGGVS